jgi:hypothetical protein
MYWFCICYVPELIFHRRDNQLRLHCCCLSSKPRIALNYQINKENVGVGCLMANMRNSERKCNTLNGTLVFQRFRILWTVGKIETPFRKCVNTALVSIFIPFHTICADILIVLYRASQFCPVRVTAHLRGLWQTRRNGEITFVGGKPKKLGEKSVSLHLP